MNPNYPFYLWYVSRQDRDWQRVMRYSEPPTRLTYRKGKGDWENTNAWSGYITGKNPDYPMQVLNATYAETLRRLTMIRTDRTTPDEQDVHHWQQRNPVVLEGLVQLMLGAPNHIYHGGLLHCSVRYFDPHRARPGMPPDVAALVDRITPEGISLQLVNLHPTEPRDVLLQAGAFGEHQFTTVRQGARQSHAIDRKSFHVRLGPGAGGQLEIGLKRFVNHPSYAFPWHGEKMPVR